MAEPTAPNLPSRTWLVLGLALLACLLFLPRLGTRDLWDPDEPRYALVSREMWRTDQFLVPHQNGRVYAEKPPLLFWIQGLLSSVAGGHGTWVARLPSAVAAVGSTVLTGLMGARLFGPACGWLAGLFFATAHLVQWNGHTGTMDSLVSFWVVLSAWLFVRRLDDPAPPFGALLPAYLALGVSTLAKGPPGALTLLVAVLAVRWRVSGRAAAFAVRPLLGLAAATGVCLLWLGPAYLQNGPAYLEAIVVKQTVVRFLQPWHHYHGPFYYFGMVLLDFLPWTGLMLLGGGAAWRLGWRGRESRWLFPLAWAVVTLVFFSFSSGKRNVYLLPCFPALALLASAAVGEWRAGRLATWVRPSLALPHVVFAGAALAALAGALSQ
ncbi:MAG: glycosyltransferase family 39 protein, partial [Candidatus Riflebacteria bacterium]|nr:glycosyltransferase family 39 protein [Candidatus Riflebacteria bacterium]